MESHSTLKVARLIEDELYEDYLFLRAEIRRLETENEKLKQQRKDLMDAIDAMIAKYGGVG